MILPAQAVPSPGRELRTFRRGDSDDHNHVRPGPDLKCPAWKTLAVSGQFETPGLENVKEYAPKHRDP